ncbi:MAG TPA: iron-sulfur cluster assembly accessory protein [Ferrovibrio sp.]|uniref:HesB/IscA family protein n=1 Tax=Ferrovibrio sp. TaxID=1917215 RepID=UPI002ED11B56
MAVTETAERRPAFKAVTLTDAAAARIRELMARADKPIVGLRIAISTKGCSGLSYDIQYAEEKGKFDEVVEDKGATVLIEPKAQMYLFGTEIDWVEDKLQSGFVFRNPNEKGRCGCGESFHV